MGAIQPKWGTVEEYTAELKQLHDKEHAKRDNQTRLLLV